jgi:hypothetical protein
VKSLLTFVLPLVSPLAAKDWNDVLDRLSETARSIDNIHRNHKNVVAILVVNKEACLRPLPACFEILRVDLPPPQMSVYRGDFNEEERAEAVKWDKGYKIAHGMIHAKQQGSQFLMGVDADDLLSNEIPNIIQRDSSANGWYINMGWLLPHGSRWGLALPDFQNWCGTHAIVRADLLPLGGSVEVMDPAIIKGIYGHHRELILYMAKAGTKLKPINFRAAVYVVNHSEGNYMRRGLMQSVLAPKKLFSNPKNFLMWLSRLRYFGLKIEKTFICD